MGAVQRLTANTARPASTASPAAAASMRGRSRVPRRSVAAAGGSRRGRGRAQQRRVLVQDRLVQPAQLRAGLDADLLDEHLTGLAVRRERLGLPARPV